MTNDKQLTLGAVLRGVRNRNAWTLKEMSAKSGIPVSTLSKIEHDRLTLSYDKLQQISRRLDMSMSELFAIDDHRAASHVTGRRSIGSIDKAIRVETDNYDYFYLCTELRQKRMIPSVTRIRAKTLEDFGPLVRHGGEEFIYVIEGVVVVHTEFYDPVVLTAGQSIYIDSGMGHAYLVGDGCTEAMTLGVMSSPDDDLLAELMALAKERAERRVLPRD